MEYDPDFRVVVFPHHHRRSQDLSKAQILTISKLIDKQTNNLSIIANAAQRIYKSGFTWAEVGIEVRGGRTIAFKKNYRNTIEIAKAAKSLLEKEIENEDFTELEYSVRRGEKPKIGNFSDFYSQMGQVVSKIETLKSNNQLNNTVILHRNTNGMYEIQEYLKNNGFPTESIKNGSSANHQSESIKLCTMSSVKGLEFDNVFIPDLNDNIIPHQSGFAEPDDQFHISTERRLLYTCMTRARNTLSLFSSNRDNPSLYLKEIDVSPLDDISPSDSSHVFNYDLPF